MRHLSLVLLANCACFGAVCQIAAAGAYQWSSAPWSCGHVPASGDQAQGADGVIVHIDTDATVGDPASPATPALDCTAPNGSCHWMVDAGVTLNILSDVNVRNNVFTACG